MAADLGVQIAEKLLETIGSQIIKEVCDMWGYQSQLEELKETVCTVRKVLLDAEAMRELSYEEQNYIEMLKDAVYDADDLFDEVLTHAELKQLRPHNMLGKLFDRVGRFFSTENQLGQTTQTYRMSRDLKKIKKSLDAIADCHDKFRFCVDYMPIIKRRVETCSYVEAKDIIGREEDKKAIINMLLDHNSDEEFCCVTIVGVGGLGKTALAQLVYNDEEVKKVFSDLRIWVCVSDQDGAQFDVKTILCKILELVTSRRVDESSTMALVRNQLQEQLRGKKYLIVLDDVWNEDLEKWLELKNFLMLGQGGGRIIVTTRSEKTGIIIGGKNMYKLNGLSEKNSWLLFELSAFNKEDKQENHHEFVEIGLKIVEKCYNIPLAIKVVGSLLYGQELSKWLSLENSGLSKIGKGDNEILSILKLSYHNLAPSLKSCFSYCALFPKDYVLKQERLISLWISQGYIMPRDGGQSIEDAAEEYFVILLRRCFFQDVEKDDCGYIKSVKIHDLMHDVAQEVGEKELQLVTSSITDELGDNIRHVAYAGNNCVGTPLLNIKIRSLLHLCGWRCEKRLVVTEIYKLKCLRVLVLQGLGVVNLPDSIGELIHLRYLDLGHNHNLKVLPDAIVKLHNLQTLLLCWCLKLRELPEEFCKLVKLRHLDLRDCGELSCMPSGMEKLTSLKVLPFFVVGKKVSREAQTDDKLRSLKALTGIRGEIRIEIGKYCGQVEGMDDMGAGYLKAMEHLAKVRIKFVHKQGGWDNLKCERVLETLELPSNVRELIIEKYDGTVIPKWGRAVDDWAIFFSRLVEIKLSECRNLQEIPVLSKLLHLKKLFLVALDNLECMETSSYSQASGEVEIFFPSLERLEIRSLKKWKGWWKGVDDDHRLNTTPLIFPCLSELVISDCPELTSFPHCATLESLDLRWNNEALQIMVKAPGKEGDNVIKSQVTANLRELRIDNLSHLKSLPINCLTHLYIYGDEREDRISKFETVEIQDCISEAFQRCASSLQHLGIWRIKNIRRLCGGSGLEHFTALESLRLGNVIPRLSIKDEEDDDEDGDNSLFWKSIPQNLRTLDLYFLEEETCLPKGMQYLTSLSNLVICGKKLEGLPEWIDCLSSLQSLTILSCPAIKSIPESMHKLSSLQRLRICYCPDLEQRCKAPDGEDHPKIRHIPDIDVR